MAAVNFAQRHLVILALGASAACGGGLPRGTAPSPSSPDATIEQFLAAANAGDLDAMALLWGDERGPSSLTNVIPRDERQRRLTIIQRLLRSDSHQITTRNTTNPQLPVITVALTQGTRRFAVPFTMVQPRNGGWLIREIGLEDAMPQIAPGQRN